MDGWTEKTDFYILRNRNPDVETNRISKCPMCRNSGDHQKIKLDLICYPNLYVRRDIKSTSQSLYVICNRHDAESRANTELTLAGFTLHYVLCLGPCGKKRTGRAHHKTNTLTRKIWTWESSQADWWASLSTPMTLRFETRGLRHPALT